MRIVIRIIKEESKNFRFLGILKIYNNIRYKEF